MDYDVTLVEERKMKSVFERYLTLWVGLCILAGYFSRKWIITAKGKEWFNKRFLPFLTPVTIIEVSVMFMLVKICTNTKNWFPKEKP
ncbi:MAG: hypothetical protein GF401_16235 [Chitinivibrionales bacterium]|nr:hypothetical protein [Chitinivibrionales bacterium]